ncbi:MAG: HEAT repeat domain-containing protein [Thermoguttaceae bacterium]
MLEQNTSVVRRPSTAACLAAAPLVLGGAAALAADKPAVDSAAVDKAFDALKTFKWGSDPKVLQPIEDALVVAHCDAAVCKALEARLAAVLGSGASRPAKDYVCRALRVIGTAQSVPALAARLADKDSSHMARYALERIEAPEAAQALREALPKLDGALKIGVIGSLGVRRDAESVQPLVALLGDADQAVAGSAACALGDIGTPEAATALGQAAKAGSKCGCAVADACLACAERLLADGKKADAVAAYKSLTGSEQPKQIRLAATRGLLAAAGK